MLKIALLVVLLCGIVGGCPYYANCYQCTLLPGCIFLEFHSGLLMCVSSNYDAPIDEFLVRSSTWPHDCRYAQEQTTAANDEKIVYPPEKNNDAQKENPSSSNDSNEYSTFNIILGVLAIFSLVFSIVDCYFRIKKVRMLAEQRADNEYQYVRFFNNEFMDTHSLYM